MLLSHIVINVQKTNVLYAKQIISFIWAVALPNVLNISTSRMKSAQNVLLHVNSVQVLVTVLLVLMDIYFTKNSVLSAVHPEDMHIQL